VDKQKTELIVQKGARTGKLVFEPLAYRKARLINNTHYGIDVQFSDL
jgi:hypothetical protein